MSWLNLSHLLSWLSEACRPSWYSTWSWRAWSQTFTVPIGNFPNMNTSYGWSLELGARAALRRMHYHGLSQQSIVIDKKTRRIFPPNHRGILTRVFSIRADDNIADEALRKREQQAEELTVADRCRSDVDPCVRWRNPDLLAQMEKHFRLVSIQTIIN